MGGPKRSAGEVVGERIVYVDSPKIVAKYEEQAKAFQEAAHAAVKNAKSSETELRAQLSLLHKEHEVVSKDRERLANLKGGASAPLSTGAEISPASQSGEFERLRFQVGRLQDELSHSQKTLAMALSQSPMPVETVRIERVIDVIEKEVKVMDPIILSIAAGIAMLFGGAVSYVARPNLPDQIQIEAPQPSPSPLVRSRK